MADIEIQALSERLSDDEMDELHARLEKLGAPRLPRPADDTPHTVAEGLNEDALAEFLDRLDAHDLACDIYLPLEFEDSFEIGEARVGSAAHLLEVLDELRDELTEEDDEDEEYLEEEEEEGITQANLRRIWKLFHEGATVAMERLLPMHVQG